MSSGRLLSGAAVGIIAAAQLCEQGFGLGAHMCTQEELYLSATNGTLASNAKIQPAWVHMPNWNNPSGSTMEPLSGISDTCVSYTYATSANRWRGIAVEWGMLPGGGLGFRWRGGTDGNCNMNRSIACCR
jgi:hypothetical protein